MVYWLGENSTISIGSTKYSPSGYTFCHSQWINHQAERIDRRIEAVDRIIQRVLKKIPMNTAVHRYSGICRLGWPRRQLAEMSLT
jgi:hypothetical protein